MILFYYQVECVQSSDPGTVKTYQLPSNSTGLKLPDLKPRHKYECRVRLMTMSVGQHSQPVSAWTLSNGNDKKNNNTKKPHTWSGLGPVEDDLPNEKKNEHQRFWSYWLQWFSLLVCYFHLKKKKQCIVLSLCLQFATGLLWWYRCLLHNKKK